MSETDPAAAVPATDNNADAVVADEYEQNKNNAGTSESQQEDTTRQTQAEQDAQSEATAPDENAVNEDHPFAEPTTETE